MPSNKIPSNKFYQPQNIPVYDEETLLKEIHYSNHVKIGITSNEIILDFYLLTFKSEEGLKPTAIPIQRINLPIGLGKGLATAIANVIATFEADNMTTINNQREAQPEDKIVIWNE